MDDLLTYVGLLRGDHLKKTPQKTCVFFREFLVVWDHEVV